MKNVSLIFALVLSLMSGQALEAQVSDYCGVMKASVQNVQQINNGIEFDIYLRSAKQSTDDCGDLFVGQTDVWLQLKGGDFSKATIQKKGGCTLTPENTEDASLVQMLRQTYMRGISAQVLENTAVLNLNSPTPSDQNGLDVMSAKLDNQPRAHRLGTFRIENYDAVNPEISIRNMDKGQSININSRGYNKFCSKSHTLAMTANDGVRSYAVQVISDHFLGDDIKKFDAKRKNKSDAQINWEMKPAFQATGYILERSDDQENWTAIRTWEGKESAMDFVDSKVYDGKAIQKVVYYRLKLESATDHDYTAVKTVVFSNLNVTTISDVTPESWSLYPNPSTEGVFVDMGGIKDETIDKIMIMDITGKLVIDHVVTNNSSKEYIKFKNNQTMASGMYFVQLMTGDAIVDQKKLEIQ